MVSGLGERLTYCLRDFKTVALTKVDFAAFMIISGIKDVIVELVVIILLPEC